MKNPRIFSNRPDIEQEMLIVDTWCPVCQKADLGLSGPFEYEENGKVFIEGLCRKCKNRVVSEITER